ncbi:MAG: 3-oxoadipyl-CoA thiolase [Gammaproteobacteria bacterium]|nr:3-oxoadipyl-CoA thiolase [Gammaproteobacteria bacterium]
MNQAIIYDGIRSPFGRYGGGLSVKRPDDLAAAVIKALLDRSGIESSLVEDVVLGNTNQAGEDCRNVARNAALLAGMHTAVGGVTVNRLCGSGAAATLDAARAVSCGQGQLFISGGVESMSRAPWVLNKAETGFDRNQKMYDTVLGWRFPNKALLKQYGDDTMPQTADNLARDFAISREDSDAFAFASQQKYEAARNAGFYEEELLEIEVPAKRRKDPPVKVTADEHPRPGTTLEKLAGLATLFEDGVVTAGNASGINDGAAALLLGNEDIGRKLGLKPRARILSGAVAGVEPRVMGIGPVPASQKALQRAGLSLADMDVVEINEAFATQVLGCLKYLQIDFHDDRVNPNGGAISIGHPLGASGARLILTALRQLERIQGRYALISMCIGIGQGIAVVIGRI